MPIEIKELHIRVSVNAGGAKPVSGGQPRPAQAAGADKDKIIAECVEQVMHILQTRKER